ncbi:MAG TPA: diheme cytochrome c [Gammaproteobacteria bacterium]|nr:diheme cytochrome c [Gammaproteobacteria bacterium]
MKLSADKLLWLLILLPAVPFIVNAYLDTPYAPADTSAGMVTKTNWLQSSQRDFAPVTNRQYQTECGSCHFAFQPGLLPQRSWEKIMNELDQHFGDNAELDTQLRQAILYYLATNSAEHSHYLRSQNLAASIRPDETPTRFTDTLYFKRKHHQIPENQVKGDQENGGFSNCNTCHQNAAQGLYNELDILIPDKKPVISTMQ